MADDIHYTEHASDILAKAAGFCKEGRAFALMSSLSIQGGSARDCGSLAVVTEDGQMYGYLSNGCIDRDLKLRAEEALRTGQAEYVQYGAGSQNFDLQLPCGGSLGVVIDPKPDKAAILAAHETLTRRQVAQIGFTPPSPHLESLGVRTFSYEPKFRLYLAGRGAVFRSMVEVSASAGFEVEAFTPDVDDLDVLRAHTLSDPHLILWGEPTETLAEMDQYAAFMTLFHDHEWEVDLLEQALQTPVRFIGCMGSMRSHETRLEALRLKGVPETELNRAHGPIGLVGSLRDAKLIALSALAEIASLRPNAIHGQAAVSAPYRVGERA